jgi:hypothetical protein
LFFGLRKENLEDLSLSGRIILNCILKIVNRVWTGFIWLFVDTSCGFFSRGNEPFDTLSAKELLAVLATVSF